MKNLLYVFLGLLIAVGIYYGKDLLKDERDEVIRAQEEQYNTPRYNEDAVDEAEDEDLIDESGDITFGMATELAEEEERERVSAVPDDGDEVQIEYYSNKYVEKKQPKEILTREEVNNIKIDWRRSREGHLKVSLYYKGNYVETISVPPGGIKYYDIGEEECYNYTYTYTFENMGSRTLGKNPQKVSECYIQVR